MTKFRRSRRGMFYKILSKFIIVQFFENYPLKEFILSVKLQNKGMHFLQNELLCRQFTIILATSATRIQCTGVSCRIYLFVERIPVATSKSYISRTKKNNMPTLKEWL